jgi:hypothetical protein
MAKTIYVTCDGVEHPSREAAELHEGWKKLNSMPTKVCPKCGNKTPFFVDAPFFRCEFCDYESRNPPKTLAEKFWSQDPFLVLSVVYGLIFLVLLTFLWGLVIIVECF